MGLGIVREILFGYEDGSAIKQSHEVKAPGSGQAGRFFRLYS
jgi:hypothetical protein